MDQIDLSIIEHLQKDGRKPFTDIARDLGISEGTVRNRVSRLLDERVIQIVGLADPLSLGFDAPAIIGVKVQPGYLERAAAEIGAFPEVSYLIMVSGEFDLFVEVMCRDRKHLGDFINKRLHQVQGINQTQSFVILGTYKMAYGALPTINGFEIRD
jgi:Lrp/AsnC family transcriptional regulator for asnA, asnC and gidA